MELPRISQQPNLMMAMVDWCRRFPKTSFYDQDFLNCTFQTRYYRLDRRYNRLVGSVSPRDVFASREPAIWHFAGKKPWQQLDGDWDI